MIGIIDYNAGNIESVQHALRSLDIPFIISKNPKDLETADRLLFPGVGHAKYAMEELKKSGFDIFLKDAQKKGIPILGICLGSQIIFEHSEEGDVDCLGLLQGTIKHFSNLFSNEHKNSLKIPHMGWNNIEFTNNCPLFENITNNSDFYFVHSYVIQPKEENVISATSNYGINFPASVWKDNVFACQFHPEKSGKPGLKILQNFAHLDANQWSK